MIYAVSVGAFTSAGAQVQRHHGTLNGMEKRENKEASAPTGDRQSTELLDLLASALEAVATAVAIVDRDRTIVWANAAVEALTGYAPLEIVGKSTPAYWSSQQSPEFYEQLFRTLLAGQKWHGEMVNRRKDGSFYDEERIITPIRNTQGEVTHFIAIGLDISERKRAEREALRLLQMADQTPNLLAMADLEGTLFFVNRPLTTVLGFATEDLVGKHFSALMAGSNPPKVVEEITRAMFSPGGWTGEVNLRRKDGSNFAIDLDLKSLLDKQGQITGCFGIGRDVTEKKRDAEALRQSHEMFESLFESSPDAMLAVDPGGRIVRLNFQVEKLFGYNRRELLGDSVERLIPEHSRLADQNRGSDGYARVATEQGDLRGRRKDGTEFPVEVSLSPLQTQSGNLVLSSIRDVTLRKQSEKTLRETHERLNMALVGNAERQSREAAKLSELVDILQSCQSLHEAYEVAAGTLKTSLPYQAGSICITSPSRNVVEAMSSWGDSTATEKSFRPEDCWALRRSRVHQVKDADSPLRCAHVRGNPPRGYFCVPLSAQGESYGVLYLESPPEPAKLSDSAPRERRADPVDIEVRQATALGERLSLAFGNLRLREALRTQSIRDSLTGLYNRRYMEESLEREISRSIRSGQSVALLLLDIDHFKIFNDTHGHQGGDTLLRTLGEFLAQRTRGQDVSCRYGGEEFAIILTSTTVEKAIQRAQILREDLKGMMVEHNGHLVGSITMSIGIAVAPEHGTTASELLRAADASLYRAKAEGRDRIIVADPPLAHHSR